MPKSPRNPLPLRLSLAIAASLLLHVVLMIGHLPTPAPKVVRLEARLLPLPEPSPPTEPIDPTLLEKDTLSKETQEHKVEPVTPPALKPPPPSKAAPSQAQPARLPEQAEHRALRKFSEYIIYPQAAVDAGREGTAHLLLTLSPDGRILSASIASSSGHADLDQAALAAVRHVGRIAAGGKTEFILPFTFRLQ